MKSEKSSEHSKFMDKWSSKPADHNANRIRNNQRRHRARAKSRMEELETRLEETTAKLEAALSTISSLTIEVESLRASQSSLPPHLRILRPRAPAPPAFLESAQPVLDLDPTHSCTTNTLPRHIGGKVAAVGPDTRAASPALATVENDSICNCPDDAPPPALGESTMSCSSAFQIIEQQNFSGVEVTTIKAWLGPGFRLRPGEACRVETNRLYELLDHITSPS